MKQTTVSLSTNEFQVLASRLRYTVQNLLDDLVMGLIPTAAVPDAPPTAIPEVEGTGKLVEVAQPKLTANRKESNQIKSTIDVSSKRSSWADEAEAEEAANKASSSVIKPDSQNPKSWSEVVKEGLLILEGHWNMFLREIQWFFLSKRN